ncbi:hypothetical protein NE237_018478 [Protea cynaroides]|uniref:Uncharacterized protein n=1 Tax=Protea cynaroides TaxID=273540 RepID=A0A9Q0QP80_9MAGN|nr:hypothetical protein NE237_018478 [Protea cynaroides]
MEGEEGSSKKIRSTTELPLEIRRARGTLVASALGEARPTEPYIPPSPKERERRTSESTDKKAADLAAIPFVLVFNLTHADFVFRKVEIMRVVIETSYLPSNISFLANLSSFEVISWLFHYIALENWRRCSECRPLMGRCGGNVDQAFTARKEANDGYNA